MTIRKLLVKKFTVMPSRKRSAILVAVMLLAGPAWADRLHTTGAEENNTAAIWNSFTTTDATYATATVHSGTYSWQWNLSASTGRITRTIASMTSGSLFFRTYMNCTTFPADGTVFMGDASGLNGIKFMFTSSAGNKRLRLSNGVTGTNADATTNLSTGTWYRIEGRHLIADSGGQMEMRYYLGDSTTLVEAASSITGEDTLPASVGTVQVGLYTTTNSGNCFFDDFGVNNSSGTFENSWLGPGKIVGRGPASDNSVTWTPFTGSTSTENVDDLPGAADDATTYVSSATANNEDRLNLTALPAEVPSDADMRLLQVFDRWDGNGTTGTRQGRHLVWDEASAQTNGPTHTRCDVAAGNWSLPTVAQTTVFDLGTRTKANVDAFDIGYEPLNNAECRVTFIWVNIEWIEAPAGVAKRRII